MPREIKLDSKIHPLPFVPFCPHNNHLGLSLRRSRFPWKEEQTKGGAVWTTRNSCFGRWEFRAAMQKLVLPASCARSIWDKPRAKRWQQRRHSKTTPITCPAHPVAPNPLVGDREVKRRFFTDFRLVFTFREERWRKVWEGWGFCYVITSYFIREKREIWNK